jgi:hypothetical protein
MSSQEQLLKQFTDALWEHHLPLLRQADDELRDAIVVKMVALTALAFGIEPTRGVPLDTDDAIAKLQQALAVIAHSKKETAI